MDTINIKEFQEIIGFSIIAKKRNLNLPIFVWGNHGVGKTTVIDDVAKKVNYNYVPLNLANQSPEELLGLPYIDKEKKITEYMKPAWLLNDSDRPTIYFLDEINRAPKYVLQSIFSFVNEGRIHTHHIQKDDVIFAAGNPANMDYDVTAFDDQAFNARFVHLYLEPDDDEVVKYFNKKKLHTALMEMLKEDHTLLANSAMKESDMVKINVDNRMLEKAGHVLNLFTEFPKYTKNTGYHFLAGMIGESHASVLMTKFNDNVSIPDPCDLFDGKVDVKNVFADDRIDIINAFNVRLSRHMVDRNLVNDLHGGENFKTYIQHIPVDCAYSFVIELQNMSVDSIDIINMFKKLQIKDFIMELYEMGKK